MIKAMVFIDGSWLYANAPRLAEVWGREYQIHYGKLPGVLAEIVGTQMGGAALDVVRTHLFSSYAANYNPLDEALVERRLDFYDMLREEYHYEVEAFPVNYRGRRVRRSERDPADAFEPREKCVDISLATALLANAAVPFAYDIAIAVLGDQDFKPVLQAVRRLGKRVAVASIRGSCAQEIADPADPARVKDFDVIWIDELLERLERRFEPRQLECASPAHQGPRLLWTTFAPRRGQRFYCDDCRAEFERQRQEAVPCATPAADADAAGEGVAGEAVGQVVAGALERVVPEKQVAFLRSPAGGRYFFHASYLEGELALADLAPGALLEGEIFRLPGGDQAGAIRKVRRRGEAPEAGAAALP